MTVSGGHPLRVLVIHAALLNRVFEAGEVWQIVTAMLASSAPGEITVSVSNCRRVWQAELVDGRAVPGRDSSMVEAWRRGADVVHIHLPIPLPHLVWAAAYRLRRVPVVFSPMALLTDDFTRASWFRGRRRMFRRLKPALVRVLAALWFAVASRVICLSAEERRQCRAPRRRTLLAPWPVPDTPLAEAAVASGWPAADTPRAAGPLAVVARLDPWRKGIDRVCTWALAHEERLPRPAVVVFAPAGDAVPPVMRAALDRGLIEWDTRTSGADLLPRLRECRAAVLLSRWEAQPRALREAVVAGVPTISTPSAHFREVVDVLGVGFVVDGDDVDDVQRAFEGVVVQAGRPGAAEALFAPRHQGRWLLEVLGDVAARRTPTATSYYDVAERHVTAMEGR